jgi:hypothetical protein
MKKDGRQPAKMLAANNNDPANAGLSRHGVSFSLMAGEVKI